MSDLLSAILKDVPSDKAKQFLDGFLMVSKYGEAASIISEAGRMISASNMKTLKDALLSMEAAMASIKPLLADNANEVVKETSNVLIDTEINPELHVSESEYKRWQLVSLDEAAKILAQADSYDSTRSMVSNALRKKAISDSLKDKVASGNSLGYDDYYDYGCMPYIRDLYQDAVVYSKGGELYQCDYSITNGVVTLGTETQVQVSYVPVAGSSVEPQESKAVEVSIRGDLIQLDLAEKAISNSGVARVKLISPGWGSSGYYSKEMLKRDGPSVFKKGTQMYMNHPTEAEARDRPERSVLDLAGVIESDVRWEDASPKNTGDGLYADAKIFGNYKSFIDEAASHIGLSIRAGGVAYEGEAENRHGYIIDKLNEGYSVDFVTMAGRGGEVLSLYESARNNINKQMSESKTEKKEVLDVDITPEQLKQFTEAADKLATLSSRLEESTKENAELRTSVTRMKEAMIIAEANNVVAQTLASIKLPDIVRNRLINECSSLTPIREDGTLDKDALITSVKEKASNELKYIESVTGSVTGGRVVGITAPDTKELTEAEVDASLHDAFASIGFTEDGVKIAARGR